MPPYHHLELEAVLSTERFARYVAWAGGDRERAVELYALNTALSEALYTPLQMLEVALRNRFHAVLTVAHGPLWFDQPGLLVVPHQLEQLAKAKAELVDAGRPIEPGRVVAELTFGFWTAFLNTDYESMWQSTLHHAVQRGEGEKGLRRKDLSGPLRPLRELRNRVAHHEPILPWNLRKHYDAILRLTGWLSPAAAAWTREHSRFLAVHPPGRIALVRPEKGQSQPAPPVR
ncbi:Abi family protein [Craurococcus roseus]|uniref:Abi family protein n=1 Tax=Craurococcus roseus TaxID=77585 RepID=A0ABN1EU52_9PROT